MNTGILITLIVVAGVACSEVLSCDSCGRECKSACGTRQFRACCYNYLRKRSSSVPLEVDPSLRLELWLARSRGAHYPVAAAPAGLFTAPHNYANIPTAGEFETRKDDLDLMNETM